MKRKLLSILLAVLLSVTGVIGVGSETKAEDMGEDLDFSYLMTENTLVGTTQMQTRGIYLAEGDSLISKIATGKIGAGGSTTAAKKCKVSVTCIVERLTDYGWARVTSWTQTNENAFVASVSKSLQVGVGFYYRVRSSHYAESDGSSSWTGALYM